ncbi:hypothetical protein V5F59_06310 [Xanthobacter autotrophicus DSM 431]|uniref:hypothetical protein n=1 Tax=Xanthobacter nonsaccharivorans TaxID=3119912 RepID=UPI00372CD8DD
MARLKYPFAGDVTQFFRILNDNMAAFAGQLGLININVVQSKAPEVEAEVLESVASYGAQLGRMGDALAVLVRHFHPPGDLTPDEKRALAQLRELLDQIADVKERHQRRAMRIPYEGSPF